MRRFIVGDKIRAITPPNTYFPVGIGYVARANPANCLEYGVYMSGYGIREWYPGSHLSLLERRGQKVMPMPEMAHVKLKLSGTSAKIELFHYTLSKLDPDWPWRSELGWKAEKFCPTCGGAIYINPNFSADDVRALAKQIDDSPRGGGGLKLKIKRFNLKGRCSKDEPELDSDEQDPKVAVINTEVE